MARFPRHRLEANPANGRRNNPKSRYWSANTERIKTLGIKLTGPTIEIREKDDV